MSGARSGLPGLLAAFAAGLLLAACGGGGGAGSGSPTPINWITPPDSTVSQVGRASTICPLTNEQNSIARNGSGNASTVYLDSCVIASGSSAKSVANIPYISVYLCAPGSTTNCAWIDHIQVDTGSEGLRIVADAIPSQVLNALPAVPSGLGSGTVSGECYNFVASYFWGGVHSADVTLGGTVAPGTGAAANGVVIPGLNLQILSDATVNATAPLVNQIPCASVPGATREDVAQDLGANGVIGIGLFLEDCHGNCANSPSVYFACPASPTLACLQQDTTLTTAGRVANPIAAAGRNGVAVALDGAAAAQAAVVKYLLPSGYLNYSTVAGSVSYGIGSGPAHQFVADPGNGYLQSTVNGVVYPVNSFSGTGAYIDSGSNSLFFSNSGPGPAQAITGLSTCASGTGIAHFACIGTGYASPYTFGSVQFASYNNRAAYSLSGAQLPQVCDAATLLANSGRYATAVACSATGPVYPGLTVVDPSRTFAGTFDWGLPFFFGRTLYFGLYHPANSTTTPYAGL